MESLWLGAVFDKEKLKPVLLITGKEPYIIDRTTALVVNQAVPVAMQSLNLSYIDGKTATAAELETSCETLPFMSEKRVTVMKEPGIFVERESGNEKFIEYLLNLGEHQILIIQDTFNTIKKNTKLYRRLDKAGMTLICDKLDTGELLKWAGEVLKPVGVGIQMSNLNYFIQQTGYLNRDSAKSLYDIENELKKLAAYTVDGFINRETIDFVIEESIDKNIFDLLTAIAEKNTGRAIEIYSNMKLRNEPVQRILYMISRQFRLLLGYRAYRSKGYSQKDIQDKLEIKSFEFQKISRQAVQFDDVRLEEIVNAILKADIAMKTTSVDTDLTMEMLIIEITEKK
ncbi:MAG: DNA polymerase III subunit delta [Gudongella sp.]|jgi:DNA polymerase-3 subunit delta|nr:DNA polymerase III subunit delta [Gudongella sp.]